MDPHLILILLLKLTITDATRRRQILQLTMHSRGGPYGPGSPDAFRGSGFRRQPCEPNRVAAAPSGLKVLGFVNAGTLYAIPGLSAIKRIKNQE